MSAKVIYPRALLQLAVVVRSGDGLKQVHTQIVPDSLHIQRRSHSHAATLDATVRGAALPFDPDHVEAGGVIAFVGDVGSMDGDVKNRDMRRFVGFMDELKREDGERGPFVQIKCRDLSSIFRAPEELDSAAIPRYEDTLFEALQRIVDSVLEKLRGYNGDSLAGTVDIVPTEALTSAKLGTLVAKPHVKGPVTMPKAKISPWEAMEHICGMCARLITMDGQLILVRQPAEAIGPDGAQDAQKPSISFLFGAEDDALPNAPAPIVAVKSVSRSRRLIRQRKGVALITYDTASRKTLYVEYPTTDKLPKKGLPSFLTDAGAARQQIKAAKGAGKAHPTGHAPGKTAGKFVKAGDRDVFYIRAGVHTEEQLLQIAQRIYGERSRQEMEGTLATFDFSDPLLSLQNGDRMTLHIAPNIEQSLRRIVSDDEKVDYLVVRLGLERDAAEALLSAWKQPRQSLFYVKGVGIRCDAGSEPEVSVEFINLVTVRV